MRWEPLYEVTQIKGDGETHPFLSPNDEFANFERWDKGNLDLSVLKKPEMLEFEYARSALKNGLKMEAELAVNPYKFGLVGSTDTHTALATADDDNFFGKTSNSEPSATRATHPFIKTDKATIMSWEETASGYAAVWATENTREALFDAMKRRETYATTGPRMIVRFFGGFDLEEKDAQDRMPARIAYTKGVPMGGDLRAAPAGKSPTFLVAALKDPIGANLDRIQIIKGWLDKAGKTQEKVYDVVWSGDRKPGSDGKVPLVGNTVDVPNATYTNSIGAPELIKVWKDPDFDPALRAFYYVRGCLPDDFEPANHRVLLLHVSEESILTRVRNVSSDQPRRLEDIAQASKLISFHGGTLRWKECDPGQIDSATARARNAGQNRPPRRRSLPLRQPSPATARSIPVPTMLPRDRHRSSVPSRHAPQIRRLPTCGLDVSRKTGLVVSAARKARACWFCYAQPELNRQPGTISRSSPSITASTISYTPRT